MEWATEAMLLCARGGDGNYDVEWAVARRREEGGKMHRRSPSSARRLPGGVDPSPPPIGSKGEIGEQRSGRETR